MRYKDTDYLHAAARVTYLENQLVRKEDLLKAIDADTAKEAHRLLSAVKSSGSMRWKIMRRLLKKI